MGLHICPQPLPEVLSRLHVFVKTSPVLGRGIGVTYTYYVAVRPTALVYFSGTARNASGQRQRDPQDAIENVRYANYIL